MTKLVSLFCFFAVFAAKAEPCAKVAEAVGETCAQLKVKLDLSQCKVEPAVREAKINCPKPDSARASVWTADNFYSAKLNLKEGGWGGAKTWELVGDINVKPRKAEASVAENREPQTVTKAPKKEATVVPAIPVLQPPDPPPAPAAASAGPPQTTISGFMDFYYAYNTNTPATTSPPTPAANTSTVGMAPANNNFHYYDLYHDQLAVGLVELTIKHTKDEVSLLVDLDFGTQADYNAQSIYVSGASDEVTKHIGQAIATYSPKKVEGLSISVGKMATHVGWEVAKAKDNWQYSRSFIYGYSVPVWHTGAAIGYAAIPNRLQTTAYIYNGWNNLNDNNHAKTYGAQLKFTPNERTSIFYNYIGGPERANDDYHLKQVHDLNATFNICSTVQMGFDFVYGSEQNPTFDTSSTTTATQNVSWQGYEVALRYQPNSWYIVSPRFEQFVDSNGYLFASETKSTTAPAEPGRQELKSYTLTNTFLLNDSLQVRLEGRYDLSDRSTKFTTNTGTSSSQRSVIFSALYQF